MFKELFELVRASGPLTMAVSADAPRGTMTVVISPKPADAKDEPALAAPLSLTATPEEFDAEFTTVLAGYRTQRLSLAEQVAATNEVLAAAREASVQKGSKAATTAMARTPVKHVAAPVAAPSAAAASAAAAVWAALRPTASQADPVHLECLLGHVDASLMIAVDNDDL